MRLNDINQHDLDYLILMLIHRDLILDLMLIQLIHIIWIIWMGLNIVICCFNQIYPEFNEVKWNLSTTQSQWNHTGFTHPEVVNPITS
jgi:hypothetical protein